MADDFPTRASVLFPGHIARSRQYMADEAAELQARRARLANTEPSDNVEDRRYRGSSVADDILSYLALPAAGALQVAGSWLGLHRGLAGGPLASELGLGDIPSSGFFGQILGALRKLPQSDPEKTGKRDD